MVVYCLSMLMMHEREHCNSDPGGRIFSGLTRTATRIHVHTYAGESPIVAHIKTSTLKLHALKIGGGGLNNRDVGEVVG